MPLLISALYLLLNIAVILLVAALLYWFLRWMQIPLDPYVLKICQAIVALLIIILIVSWFAGVIPPRGIFHGFAGVSHDHYQSQGDRHLASQHRHLMG